MKEANWVKRIILIIITLITCFLLVLVSYVVREEQLLQSYAKSLSNLPEVASVEKISTFSGDEFYYVAKVKLKNETTQYYFIKDDAVVHYESEENLLTTKEVVATAQSIVAGEVKHYYLGMFEERPIYEVLIGTDSAEHYVIIDAKTNEVMKEIVVQ